MKLLQPQVNVSLSEIIVPEDGSFEWQTAEVQFRTHCDLPPSGRSDQSDEKVWCIWHQPTRQIIVVGFPKSDGDFYGVDTVGWQSDQTLHCWSVPFQANWDGRRNVSEFLAFADHLLVAYGRSPDEASRAAVLHEIDDDCWYHVSHPFGDAKNGGRIIAGLLVPLYEFCFILGWLSLRYRSYRSALVYRRYLTSQGWRVRRPSLLRFFLKRRKTDAEGKYRRLVNDQVRRAREEIRQVKHSEKRAVISQQRSDQLRQAISWLSDQALGQLDLGTDFRTAYTVALDETLYIEDRWDAYWLARSILAERVGRLDRKGLAAISSRVDALRTQVNAIHVPSLPRKLRKGVEQLLTRAGQNEKLTVQLYCYEHILALIDREEGEPVLDRTLVHSPEVDRRLQGNGQPLPAQESDWIQMLGVTQLVPPQVDHLHVETIIITGLLKPGQIGRSYFNKRYRTAEYVHHDVLSKLGSRFNPSQYGDALAWLIDQGVVFVPKKINNQLVYSLNPHDNPETAKRMANVHLTQVGSEIISRILKFKHQLTTLTSA